MIDSQLDLFGILVSFTFTVLVLSYALGDNLLFRLAVHIFIGAAAGYAAAVALRDVLLPRLGAMNPTQMMVALLWILLLAMKLFGSTPRISRIGNLAAALMVGVGAAVAVGGAIQGTLVPQVSAASNFFNSASYDNPLQALVWGSFALVGTITSLAHFHFNAKAVPNQIPKRARLIELVSMVGQVFISIALGVIFAGVYSAALLALIERFYFIVQMIDSF
jgi:hypothetical protein